MIAFRHADPRFPFLRETASPSAGRWNRPGQLTHCLSDTPDGAWAEFLRHEEITDPEDISHVRRALWAVEMGDAPAARPRVSARTLTGGRDRWAACQREADRLRRSGAPGLTAPSAALLPGAARGVRVEGGERPGPPRDGLTIVLFGSRPDLVGWRAAAAGRPDPELLRRVRHF
jgi:hypothetical protein